MKWNHIDLAVAVSTGRAWWEEIEPFYGENREEIGPDRRADRPMISPPCSSPEGSRGKPLPRPPPLGKQASLLLRLPPDIHDALPFPTPPPAAPTRPESRHQGRDTLLIL